MEEEQDFTIFIDLAVMDGRVKGTIKFRTGKNLPPIIKNLSPLFDNLNDVIGILVGDPNKRKSEKRDEVEDFL